MNYPAHICENRVQTVKEHCIGTAAIAAEVLKSVGMENTAYLSGILHDMGKYTKRFKEYIEAGNRGENVIRGSVNHTFAGVRFVLNKYHNGTDIWEKLTAEIIAYAIGAHHGLFDCVNEMRKNGFFHRMEKEDICYEEAVKNYLSNCCGEDDIDKLFELAVDECKHFFQPVTSNTIKIEEANESSFYMGMLARLALSGVIEGDHSDTAQFMTESDRKVSVGNKDIWYSALQNVEAGLETLNSERNTEIINSKIVDARKWISEKCKEAAGNGSGIYRFNVPTGGGKTLGSLRFALKHAYQTKKKRIIFTSPLLSILDQNAEVIRKFVKNDNIILEHHSNLVVEEKEFSEWNNEEILKENWNAPIIITTMVQLLNAMFDGKTSCIRRFHALCDSVIVIDEVQTVPTKMITMFNLAVNFLTVFCNTTIVLCSATQPCFEKTGHSFAIDVKEIVPFEKKIWDVFKRTEIIHYGQLRMDEIPNAIREIGKSENSILVVCNKKSEAEQIYRELSAEETNIYYLSSSLCMQHRRNVLCDMQDSMKKGERTVCISTQVIEAGVDISFSCVVRLSAGMDNIIQAAGRCNRNGESKASVPVYIISCTDENLTMLKEIKVQKDATEELLCEYQLHTEEYGNDLSSNQAIEYYYRSLYRIYHREAKGYFDYYCPRDDVRIYDLLSDNIKYYDDTAEGVGQFVLNQAFAKAGKLFEVFDNQTVDVLVPYRDGKAIISDLCSEEARFNIEYRQTLLNRAKPYTISLYGFQFEKLREFDGVAEICDGEVMALQDGFYNHKIGFDMKAEESSIYLEV